MDRNQENRSKIQDLRSELSLAEVEGVIGDAKEFLRRIWPFLKLGIPLSTIIAVIGAGDTQNVNAEAAKAFQLRESKSKSSEDILGSNRVKIESLGLSKKTLELLVTEAQSGEPPIGRGRITSSRNVNLRSETNTNSQILRVLLPGTELFILENPTANSPWYRIRTDDGSEGYIHSDLMESIDATPEAAPEPNTAVGTEPAPAGTQEAKLFVTPESIPLEERGFYAQATVVAEGAVIRQYFQEPGYNTIFKSLHEGDELKVEGFTHPWYGNDGEVWYEVSTTDGNGNRLAGFIRARSINIVIEPQNINTSDGPSLEGTNTPQSTSFKVPEWLGDQSNFPLVSSEQLINSNAIITGSGKAIPLGLDISLSEIEDEYFTLFSSTLPEYFTAKHGIEKTDMSFVSGFIVPDEFGNYIRRQVMGGVDGYFIRVGTPRGINNPIEVNDLAQNQNQVILEMQQYFFALVDPTTNDPTVAFNGGDYKLSEINEYLSNDWSDQRLTQISFLGIKGQSTYDFQDGRMKLSDTGGTFFTPVPLTSVEFGVFGNQVEFSQKYGHGAWVTL